MSKKSKPQTPPNDATNPVHPKDTAEIEGNLAHGKVAITCHIHPPPSEPRQTQQPRYQETPRWKKWLEISAVAIACVVAAIYYLQLRSMQKSVDLSRNTARTDQRPWLGPDIQMGIPNGVASTTNLFLSVVAIKNNGKTPAKKVLIKVVFEVVDSQNELRLSYDTPATISDSNFLFQGTQTTVNVYPLRPNPKVSAGAEPRLLTVEEVSKLNSGVAYLSIYGHADYEDIFGVSHWLNFCTWKPYGSLPREYHARKCTDYNDTDTNVD